MATKKSDDKNGGEETVRPSGGSPAPAPDLPPDLSSDPIDPAGAPVDPAGASMAPMANPTEPERDAEAMGDFGRAPVRPVFEDRAYQSVAESAAEPAAEPAGTSPAQSEPAVPVAAEHVEEEAHEEERGWSFAARALTFLVVLIAGAALGIWGAPKVAPMLPAGLAPVAAWLTPGVPEAETRFAALESSLGALTAQVEAGPTAADIEARAQGVASEAQGLVTAAQEDLGAQIAAVRATLDQTDFTEANERIGRLETAIEGASAELGSLREQIAAGAATGSGDVAATIDTYRAELDGLRAEVGGLSGSISGLGARLTEAMTSAEARVTEAEAQAANVQEAAVAARDLSAAQADLAAIRAALADGAPFAEPLDRLAASAGVTAPEGLVAAAASGVQTPAQLRATFSDAAHGAIRASIVAGAGDGLVARSRAFLESNIASRSLTPQDGATPDAVLSRMEDALRRDDLGAALTEAGALPSEAAAAMSDWIAAAKLRADAEAGLAELTASVSAMN